MDHQRTEQDSMGPMYVPADAHYGAQTARAVENFPVSGQRLPGSFIVALARIKRAAASVSQQLGRLDSARADWIAQAASEVIDGQWADQFVVDVFQTGSGTSTNMNINEVLASRANEIATGRRGGREPVHPNDHVNLQQSSNDVIPSAMHLAAAGRIRSALEPALARLYHVLADQARELDDILTIGRTHLQDATPVRLGQIFGGYARQIELATQRAAAAVAALCELPLGGTAVGTGINAHAEFAGRVITILAAETGLPLFEAMHHFEAQSSKDGVVQAMGHVRTIALSLAKIANDIRLLASGPRCGLGELVLQPTQPGSSIMPGKINPVMCEMMLQVVAKVIGNDATIAFAASPVGSVFELNMMMPVMTSVLIESIDLLASATTIFSDRCIVGLTADRERCEALVEQSLSLATSLVPHIGYDRAAALAKTALANRQTIRQVAIDEDVLPIASLTRALDPAAMTKPDADSLK